MATEFSSSHWYLPLGCFKCLPNIRASNPRKSSVSLHCLVFSFFLVSKKPSFYLCFWKTFSLELKLTIFFLQYFKDTALLSSLFYFPLEIHHLFLYSFVHTVFSFFFKKVNYILKIYKFKKFLAAFKIFFFITGFEEFVIMPCWYFLLVSCAWNLFSFLDLLDL